MTSVLFTIGGDVMSALALSGTNFFSKLTDHGKKENKRHNFVLEKLQRAKENALIISIKDCRKKK